MKKNISGKVWLTSSPHVRHYLKSQHYQVLWNIKQKNLHGWFRTEEEHFEFQSRR